MNCVEQLFLEPPPPGNFDITMKIEYIWDMDVQFEWDPPQGSSLEVIDYYNITITTRLTSTKYMVYSTILRVILDYNVKYTVTITTVNCAGESSPVLKDIEFGT